MPPTSRNQNRKSRSRQTTLKFASSPLPPAGSELRSTTGYPSSPTRPRFNKPSQPRDAFQAIMPNSSPIPRKIRSKSPIILDYSDSDSEGSTSVLWRSRNGKRKRGVIGIAESRSGVSAGFFGGGLSQGRSKKIGVGRGEESDDEEDDKPAVSKKKFISPEAEEDEEESEDEKLKKTIRNKIQRRVKQEPEPVLESIKVASGQVNGRVPTKKLRLIDESDEGEESAEETRLKTLIRGRKKARKSADDEVVEEEEQLEPKRGQKSKGKEDGKDRHKGKNKQEEVIRIQSDTEEDDVIALPTRPRERNNSVKATATPKKRSYISPDREEDEEEDDVRPAGKRGKLKHSPMELAVEEADEGERVPAKSSSPQVTQAMKDKVKLWMIESEDDEQKNEFKDLSDSSVRIPPRRGHHKAAVEDSDEGEKESKWGRKFTDAISDTVDLSDFELHDPQPITIPRRKQKPPPISNLITPSRRRRLVPAGKSSPVPAADDDSDLGSDTELAAQTPVLNSRTRYGDSAKKLSAYQRKLQQLKAKREGVDLESSDDDGMEPRRALYDSDDGLDNVQLEDEEEEEEQGDGEESIEAEIRELEPHRRQKSPRRHDGELDSDIDSFIVTDSDSDPLGAPDDLNGPSGPIARIPIQFTSQSHASLKIHFKTVVQYILNLLLNPAFPKDDEYFTFALHAIDRKVDSFRDSVLKSEAWKSNFMLALKSRPGFEFDPNGGDGFEDHCMACNRRDRNASYTVRFTGRRYDPETFEDYSSDDEESEDEVGNVIPPSGTSFPVGRYCYERSEITHSFWHWKKGLRTALEDILTHMGVFDEDVVKKVEGMKRKERWKWVDSKLGDLEKGGDVDLLWDMFNAQMKRAEEFMGRPKRYFLAR